MKKTVFSFHYTFDPVTGNLTSRNLHGTEEHFFYDTDGKHLNRLAGTGPDEFTVSETYTFADNGNIAQKYGVGQYFYDSQKKNAVTQIDIPGLGDIQEQTQQVQYNHFNSASEIEDLDHQLRVNLEYGPDDQRRLAEYWDDTGEQAELIKTRIYAGAFEKQINADLSETEVHYISVGGMLVAMYVVEAGVGSYYYPHLDHLGSIIHITDANGDIVYTQSFDACVMTLWFFMLGNEKPLGASIPLPIKSTLLREGRTRNPDDLSYSNIPERPDWLWRGYTGHEHLDEFGLINMNGRLYDPVVGRMLSPDNYVQSPDFSQSYNRYSYVWNNPLKYTDPSGEIVFIAPHIGVSSSGSLDIGVSVGVGFKGGLSAQVTVGHSFGNGGNTYATLSASVAGATAYVGYSSQGGAMAGVGFGIGPGMGGFTTNATSAGINWSQKGGFTANASIFSYNQHGGFNVHVSAGYSQGFEVGGNKRLNQTLSDNPHYNDDPDLLAWANGPGDPRKPAKPRAGIDKDVLGDGVRNDGVSPEHGGFIFRHDQFYSFMLGQANNNPVEVTAFALDDGAFFVQPWVNNTPTMSFNDPSGIPGYSSSNIIGQYHTHPQGGPTGFQDATLSRRWEIPVHAITPTGEIWRVALNRNYMPPIPIRWTPFLGGDYMWPYFGFPTN